MSSPSGRTGGFDLGGRRPGSHPTRAFGRGVLGVDSPADSVRRAPIVTRDAGVPQPAVLTAPSYRPWLRPVETSLPGYKHAERRLDAAVAEALDLVSTDEARECVEGADAAVGEHELAAQFPGRGHEAPDDLHHDPGTVHPDEGDKSLFLGRARDLGLR